MLITYLTVVGFALASFIGTLSYRLPRHISILSPPSFCPHCQKRLKLYDLIPVLSYSILRGRCRYCGGKIPVQYFISEIFLPLIYIGLYFSLGITPLFFIYAYLTTILMYLSLLDIDTGYITVYDTILVYISAIALMILSIQNHTSYSPLHYLYGLITAVVLVFVSYGVIFIIKRRIPMGAGDLLVIPGVALHFGLQNTVYILLFSSVLGVFIGIILIIGGVVKRNHKFPLFPFLTAGVLITLFAFHTL